MSVRFIFIISCAVLVISEANGSLISKSFAEAIIQVIQQNNENDNRSDQICGNQMINLLQELLKAQFWAINGKT